MAQGPKSAPGRQGSPDPDARERWLAERERQLADARAEFRRERDAEHERIAAARAEADRLLREAKELHHETTRTRDRTRRLAVRYARRVKQKWADVRAGLEAERAALEEIRTRHADEVTRFQSARSDFHVAVAESNDRLRDGWATLEAQRQRAAAEWTETNDFFAAQEAALAARGVELTAREKAVAGGKAKLETETAGLRQEAAGLEARIQHARAAVEELERKRDHLRAELLATRAPSDAEPPGELRVALDRSHDRDLTQWAAELDARDAQVDQERLALAELKTALHRDAAALADRQKVLAEQFVMLASARGEWQDAERRTVAEMEDLACGLRQREEELDTRERRLLRADSRRREDAHDLWRLRLRLEAWQTKLTAFERQWHAERQTRDGVYARRLAALTHREAAVENLLLRWERVRTDERDRLRTELRGWADDRARLAEAVAECDRRGQEMLSELVGHAARAMAAERQATETGTDAGTDRAQRRLDVMRKRWERVFRKLRDEIDDRRTAAAADLVKLDERGREIQQALIEIAEREAALNNREARREVAAVSESALLVNDPVLVAVDHTDELAALREEVERMAAVLLDAGVPEATDEELPWATEEAEPEMPAVLAFPGHTQAA